ncbi:hypothetical protein DM860_009978 [Cuscuta australis]|uniref:Uncharacterized protein n=1 Tax=Cuscuta australis TaxID=267555 RepID=A0A328DCL2_9ASTE|nr:hypothetical protein DM860_009978 [Cuscuta australis]
MASPAAVRRSGGGLLEGLYRVIMRRNSVYVTFVVAGAFVGERVRIISARSRDIHLLSLKLIRVVDYGIKKLWEQNNIGKRYEDIPVLGQRPSE